MADTVSRPSEDGQRPTGSEGASGEAEAFVAVHLRRNFVALALDYGFFGLGMSFSSTSTVLPALAERLGAPNVVLGALPLLVLLGRATPALFSARLIEPLPRKLPFVLTYTLWERLPWLLLALAVFTLGESRPGLSVGLLLSVLAAVALVGGALSPAWLDLVGKVIPATHRGRFFAAGGAFSTGLGLAGAAASGFFLREFPFPAGYALCLGATFLCLMISYGAMTTAREPAAASLRPAVRLRTHLGRLPRILRSNASFSWYMAAQGARVLGMMAMGFFAVYALRFLGATEGDVAGFTFALLAGQAAGGLALGYLADRVGHRTILVLGAGAAAAAGLLPLLSPDLALYHGVFLLAGLGIAAQNVSSSSLVMDLCEPAERPTYLGLASTAQAPFALAAPLLASLLADGLGLGAVFGAAALLNAMAAVYLLKIPQLRPDSR